MKICVLAENTSSCPDIQAEHGLSLYIETADHTILFDAGQSELFAKNAEILDIDLTSVDIAVLSHGHYDHGDGLLKFMEINKKAPVYVRPEAFSSYYSNPDKYIGLAPELKTSGRFITVPDHTVIDDGLELFSCNDLPRKYPTDHGTLTELCDGVHVPDNFLHEQYLSIRENGKHILISGCSHKGILNITEWFKPDVLIGGFHFKNVDLTDEGQAFLAQSAVNLSRYETTYYTCHCTGTVQYEYMKTFMNQKLHYLSAGDTLVL